MTRYSAAMKAVWAKKTPEERRERGRFLARHRWRIYKERKSKHSMAMIKYIGDDGSEVDFLDPAGVAAAVAAAPVTGSEVVKDVVVENTDGTNETMDPASAA